MKTLRINETDGGVLVLRAHLYVSACPVECRLPWLCILLISGPWRLPLLPFRPTLLMLLFPAVHTSDGDILTTSMLSSSDWSD